MNIFKKIYCRIFQNCFKLVIPVLPYQTPEILKSTSLISHICMDNQISKVMVITDATVRQLGILDRMCEHLDHHSIEYVIYDKTVANPTSDNVEEARNIYLYSECQALIGFGGGSSMDCAKAVGARLARPKKPLSKMEGILKIWKKIPLLICVPTTAGTGSETTLAAVIVDSKTRHKYAINDFYLIPDYAVLDPKPTLSLPPFITACTGMDALTHAIEAYVSTMANPLTDAAALKAIKMITQYLPKAVANGEYMKARDNMAYAQYLAGIAFNNASLGYVHAMAHQLGGFYNLPHGVCNAILLPYVESFNLIGNLNRFRDIAEAMGENVAGLSTDEAALKAISAIQRLGKQVGIPKDLKSLGVKPEDFAVMAENAKKDVCQLTNPRKATKEQVIELYRQAYEGEAIV